MPKTFLCFFILLIGFTALCKPVGPKSEYNVIYNLKNNWEAFDQKSGNYLPFYVNSENEFETPTMKVDLEEYKNAYILVRYSGDNAYLFFDKKLKTKLASSQWYVFNIEKLKNEFGLVTLPIHFFGKINAENLDAYIGYPRRAQVEQNIITKVKNLNQLPKIDSSFKSLLGFSFLMILGFISFLGNSFTKALLRYFDLSTIMSKISKENAFLINKPLDRPNILFVILTSIVVVFLTLVFSQNSNIRLYSQYEWFQQTSGFGIMIINFLVLWLIILTTFIGKYFFLKIVGSLFSLDKIVDIHFFRMIQFTLVFSSIAGLFLLINHNAHFLDSAAISFNLIKILLSLFFIFRLLAIFYTITATENSKTLYIICYLCIVEFLPIILGFKLFV